jgi:hypothetical protein
MCLKHVPKQGVSICNGTKLTIDVNIITKIFKFLPSSLTYTMILFVTLNSTNNAFIYKVKITLDVSLDFKKGHINIEKDPFFIQKFDDECKMSNPNLDIHKLIKTCGSSTFCQS